MNELLKDISAKIPYGPLKADFEGGIIDIIGINSYGEIYPDRVNYTLPVDEVKPYLRPMSSMTEEEEKEYNGARNDYYDDLKTYDWLDKNRFDYRGLIEKGLALEAMDGMYETKQI